MGGRWRIFNSTENKPTESFSPFRASAGLPRISFAVEIFVKVFFFRKGAGDAVSCSAVSGVLVSESVSLNLQSQAWKVPEARVSQTFTKQLSDYRS